ncbi:RcnB family protein [Caulobacter soli]|uniref:RcnB family protein n=1 Tax=Caulobacter soli TaxID=2708539 RepID=UPI0013E9DA60|nr:RcnB family protein [Caulobacter soli]
MKKFLTAAVALSIVASAGVASAQPGPQRPDQHQQQGPGRHDDDRHDQRGDNNNYERNASKRYKAPSRYQPPRGYQARQWHRGDKLPSAYRGKAYTVDYRHYGLSAPPRGYQYVRVNNDVVLTAVATGVVASVIYQLFQ